jgi:NADH:ubiquinone oxidoreductase subunit 5 (subunit L)/multisubunit Na+/H+ antiporter MnhA subunit
MRRYGALAKLLPVTCGTFIVGWLAIAGVPPFSGFWSKDEILAYAWDNNVGLWAVGWITAVLTAFYMSRQVFLTFFGRYRYADATPEEIGEAWDTRTARAGVAADEADAAVEAARAEVTAAQGKVGGSETALATARDEAGSAGSAAAAVGTEQLEAARVAVTEAGDDKDAKKAAQATLRELEKPGKDLDKAEKAAAKAEESLGKARAAVATAEARVEELVGAAALQRRQVDDVRAESARRRPDPAASTLLVAPSTEGVEEDLPADVEHRRHLHPHESPPTMVIPLVVLALGALLAGALNLPFSSGTKVLEHWLEPSTLGNEHHLGLSGVGQLVLAVITALAALGAIAAAALVYLRARVAPATIEKPVLARAWYIDDTLAEVTAGPGLAAFDGTAAFDREVVDGSVNGAGRLVRLGASRLRVIQTGNVRNYALGVAVGAVALIGLFLSQASF